MSDRARPRDEALLAATPHLQRLARSLVGGDEHAAGDLVQDTWVLALGRSGAAPRDAGGWSFGVLRRLLLNRRRTDANRRAREQERGRVAASSASPAPDEIVERELALQGVTRAVDELREPYRTAIQLRYWGDLTPTQIAEQLDVPLDTVKARLRRGLELMRQRLDREHDGDRHAWVAPLLVALDLERLPPAAPPRIPAWAVAAAVAVPALVWFGWSRSLEATAPDLGSAEIAHAGAVEAPARPPAEPEVVDRSPEGREPVAGDLAEAVASAVRAIDVLVVDEAGEPVADAEIVVNRVRVAGRTSETGRLELQVEEAELGERSMADFSEHVGVHARKAGYVLSTEFYLPVEPGQREHLTLRLTAPGLVVRGRVEDAYGHVVADARAITVPRGQDQGAYDGSRYEVLVYPVTRTDDAGRFELVGLPSELHELLIHADGFVPVVESFDGRAGGEHSLSIVLDDACEVTGQVRYGSGRPVATARVAYEGNHWMNPLVWNRADADGRYTISSMPPGRRVLLAKDTERPWLIARTVVDAELGAPIVWDPVLEEVDGVQVRLVDPEGEPIVDWPVFFRIEPGIGSALVHTDANGVATTYAVPAGDTVDVLVRESIVVDRFPRLARLGLAPGPEEHRLVVERDAPGGSIAGVVVDAHGAPPEDAQVWAVSVDARHGVAVEVDPQTGAFRFDRVPDATYRLAVEWAGRGMHQLAEPWVVADGEPLDVKIELPPTGRVLVDWTWPVDERVLHYGVKQGQAGLVVRQGPAPPPATLELLPGTFVLEVRAAGAAERLQYRTFVVRPEADVVVETGVEHSSR